MHTFRKLPQHRPRAKIAASKIVSKLAKCPYYQGLHDYRRFVGSPSKYESHCTDAGVEVVAGNEGKCSEWRLSCGLNRKSFHYLHAAKPGLNSLILFPPQKTGPCGAIVRTPNAVTDNSLGFHEF